MLEPSLFSPTWTVPFERAELAMLRRPIIGATGGNQIFLRELTDRLRSGRFGDCLEMTDEELLKCCRYAAYNDGRGGYQQAFKTILRAARRAGWREVQP